MPSTKVLRASLLIAAVLLGGCFDFEEESEVIDLRVLAVRIDPPEVMVVVELSDAPSEVDADTVYTVQADPAPVQATVLAVNPKSDEPFTYQVTACVWSETYRCAEYAENEKLAVTTGSTSPGEFDFGFAPSAEMLNTWLAIDPYRGFGGLFVLLEIRIEQPGEPVNYASKLVTYNVPFVPKASDQDPPPPKLPNKNPRLTALEIDELPTVDETPVPVALDTEVTVIPIFNEDANIETYPVVRIPSDANPELGYVLLTEKIEFEFYVTGGSLGANQIATRDPTGEATELESTWTAPDKPEEVIMWMVMRDDRGGASWVRRVLAAGGM